MTDFRSTGDGRFGFAFCKGNLDSQDFGNREFGIPMPFAAGSHAVNLAVVDVFLMSAPGEVFKSIVLAISVEMTALFAAWAGAYEGTKNDGVD